MAPRAGISHDAVIQAAYEMVDTSGAGALTLTALAAVLGVRVPSLYNHVNGLTGLQHDLTLRALREFADALTGVVVGRERDEAVTALALAYRDFVREHPGIYQIMLRSAPGHRQPNQELEAAEARPVQVALRVLAGYGLDGADALHAVRALRSIVHGFATLEATGGFGLPLDLDESFRRLVGLYVEGLSRYASPKPEPRERTLSRI